MIHGLNSKGTMSRITETEDRISEVEDKMVEINEAERKKKKEIPKQISRMAVIISHAHQEQM